MRDRKLCCAGTRIFFGDSFPIDKGFLEGRIGISYNFRMTERGLLMSVDKTASSFIIQGPLLNTVKSICGPNFYNNTGAISPKLMKDVVI